MPGTSEEPSTDWWQASSNPARHWKNCLLYTSKLNGKQSIEVVAGTDAHDVTFRGVLHFVDVSLGNALNTLLPIELAHSADRELEDLFVYKYLTRKLQRCV